MYAIQEYPEWVEDRTGNDKRWPYAEWTLLIFLSLARSLLSLSTRPDGSTLTDDEEEGAA